MLFGLRYDNSIIEVMSPEAFSAAGGGARFLREAPLSQVRSRFVDPTLVQTTPTPPAPYLVDQPNSIAPQHRVLPIACSVSWGASRRQNLSDEIWETVGVCEVRYSDAVARLLRHGMLVKFREQHPGRDQFWYRLLSSKVRKSPFGGIGTIKYDLAETPFDTNGIGVNTNDG